MNEAIEEILSAINGEVKRQNEKWGDQNHKPIEWIAILTEEVGEAAKEALDFHFNYPPKADWEGSSEDLQKARLAAYRKELIQVSAVAVQMVASLDRNELATPE